LRLLQLRRSPGRELGLSAAREGVFDLGFRRFGWRCPFYVLGLAGAAYALVLGFLLVEPVRGQSEETKPVHADPTLPETSSIKA